jgi:hypothetical protein
VLKKNSLTTSNFNKSLRQGKSMSADYEKFVSRYRIRNIQVNRSYDRVDVSLYSKPAAYYTDREETIDMDIPRYSFEELVRATDHYDQMINQHRHEQYLRKRHPAIAEAYDKYQMLLALYR